MVMGHVAVGKTTNYIGPDLQGRDAGYRPSFCWLGITNSLRSQTAGAS